MRRQILQLALLVVALTTSLYGIDQMQTAPSGTMMQENQAMTPEMSRHGGNFQRPEISSTQTVKDITADTLVLDNGLVLKPLDKKSADLMHSIFKANEKVAVKFSHFGLMVKPVDQDAKDQHFVRMNVWEVHPGDITVTNVTGKSFQLSDNTNWKVGFFVPRRALEQLKVGTPVVPVMIETFFGNQSHAIVYYNDAQGHPQRVLAKMVNHAQPKEHSAVK